MRTKGLKFAFRVISFIFRFYIRLKDKFRSNSRRSNMILDKDIDPLIQVELKFTRERLFVLSEQIYFSSDSKEKSSK